MHFAWGGILKRYPIGKNIISSLIIDVNGEE